MKTKLEESRNRRVKNILKNFKRAIKSEKQERKRLKAKYG